LRIIKLSNKVDKPADEAETIEIDVCKTSRGDFIKEIRKMPGGKNVLECIQCGSCAGGCPSLFAMDYSPMQIIKLINLGMKEEVLLSETIWLCSTCHTCVTRCPRNVDFPTLMMSLRNMSIRENLVKDHTKSDFHKYFFKVVNKYGRMHEPELMVKFLDITSFNSLLHTARLGLRLLRRGKLHLRAQKIKQTSCICGILEKTDEKETK
jgi:heterodisulfide reductase subunit C